MFYFEDANGPLGNLVSPTSHNELDLPGLTNPLMYEKIAARRSVPQRYEDKLIVRPFSPPFSQLPHPQLPFTV